MNPIIAGWVVVDPNDEYNEWLLINAENIEKRRTCVLECRSTFVPNARNPVADFVGINSYSFFNA